MITFFVFDYLNSDQRSEIAFNNNQAIKGQIRQDKINQIKKLRPRRLAELATTSAKIIHNRIIGI